MSTKFNLIGRFQRVTQTSTGPGRPRKAVWSQEKHILKEGMSIADTLATARTKEGFEAMADKLALSHAKRTQYEQVWLLDWELQEVRAEREVC